MSAPRPRESQGGTGARTAATDGGGVPDLVGGEDDGDLDLSHICYPLIGCVLVLVWWLQVVYPHFFSVASTGSLVSLTILYLASVVNTYVY